MCGVWLKSQEVNTILQTFNIFFVNLCKNMHTILEPQNTDSTVKSGFEALRICRERRGKTEKRGKQVDKQIINYVNNGGEQRFCLFLGV